LGMSCAGCGGRAYGVAGDQMTASLNDR
jgi:hypothetical protein